MKGKKDYTSATGKSVVITIEAVYELGSVPDEYNLLEHLCEDGYAEIVSRQVIAEDFKTATDILRSRARIDVK